MDEQLKKEVQIIVAAKWYEIVEYEKKCGIFYNKEKQIFHISEFVFGIGMGIITMLMVNGVLNV